MSGETQIHLVGTLTADPELRFTPKGDAVASFTVASTPRKFNASNNMWEDQDSLFLRCSIWKKYAEHVVESLRKGDQVIVVGDLVQRSYETREGEKRTVYEVQATEVAVGLRFRTFAHTADRERAAASLGTPVEDPWATPPANEEPPF
jgi:single-strand DNA-binding protein